MRVLVLYDWIEELELAKHPGVLVRLVEDAGFRPNRASIFVNERKERRRTISKNTNLLHVISEFESYYSISLDETAKGDYLDIKSTLSCQPTESPKKYVLARMENEYSVPDVIRHLRKVCNEFTPRYGFSHVGEGLSAIFFVAGIVTSNLPHDVWTRISDLGRSLFRTKEHLSGKLHDVYEVNILSRSHLSNAIRGMSLSNWIQSGLRGDLVKIQEDVYAWVVPDAIRAEIRWVLFREGLLIASV